MNPDQERKLDGAITLIARVDERTELMQKNHQRAIDGIHARITDVRKEGQQDVKDLRGEVKRLSGIIAAGVSAVVGAGAKMLGLGGS